MRLGGSFYDAYNSEVDLQRKRRSENAKSFNDFVKMKQEAGERVDFAELQRMRDALAGGSAYLAGVLPSNAMLEQTAKTTADIAATEESKRSVTRLKQTTQELTVLEDVIVKGNLTDVDITTGAGKEKFEKLITEGKLGEAYQRNAGVLKGVWENARSKQVKNAKEQIGYDKIESKEALEVAAAVLPAWVRSALMASFEKDLVDKRDAKVNTAIQSLDLKDIITTSMGDEAVAIKAAQDKLEAGFGFKMTTPQSQRLAEYVKGVVKGQFNYTTKNAIAGAVNNVTGDQLDNAYLTGDWSTLARLALQKGGLVAPSQADIDETAKALRTAGIGRAKSEMIRSSTDVASAAAKVPLSEMKVIDTIDQLNQKVDEVAATHKLWSIMSSVEKDRLRAQIRPILQSRMDQANNQEAVEQTDKFNTAVTAKGSLVMAAMAAPNIADRQRNTFEAYNKMREEARLAPVTKEYFDTKVWPGLEASASIFAAANYETRVVKAREAAGGEFDNNLKVVTEQFKSRLGTLDKKLYDTAFRVAKRLEADFHMTSSQAKAVADIIQSEGQRWSYDPQDTQSLDAKVKEIATRFRLLPNTAAGRAFYIKQYERDQNLIRPGTDSKQYWDDRNEMTITRQIEAALSELSSIALDDTERFQAKRSEFLAKLVERKESYKAKVNQDDYRYALSDHDIEARIFEHNKLLETFQKRLMEAKPTGTPTYFHTAGADGPGFYTIPSDLQNIDPPAYERMVRAGLRPGVYKRLPNGQFQFIREHSRNQPQYDPTWDESSPMYSPMS
jgi:hypothetical protein